MNFDDATKLVEQLLRSGDPAIFDLARDQSGNINVENLISAALRTRDRLVIEKVDKEQD